LKDRDHVAKSRYVVYIPRLSAPLSIFLSLKTSSNKSFFQQPLLIQFRIFYNGYAVKGTFLTNKKVSQLSFMSQKSDLQAIPQFSPLFGSFLLGLSRFDLL